MKRSTGNQGFQIWIDKLREWLKEQTYADNSLLLIENSSWDKLSSDQLPDDDVPIWIAAQRAVSRYEGILSPVGPRGRLLRRLLTWTGLIPSLPEATIKTDDETKHLEGHVRLDPKKMSLSLHFRDAISCLGNSSSLCKLMQLRRTFLKLVHTHSCSFAHILRGQNICCCYPLIVSFCKCGKFFATTNNKIVPPKNYIKMEIFLVNSLSCVIL